MRKPDPVIGTFRRVPGHLVGIAAMLDLDIAGMIVLPLGINAAHDNEAAFQRR
jgi:hypothetical protein